MPPGAMCRLTDRTQTASGAGRGGKRSSNSPSSQEEETHTLTPRKSSRYEVLDAHIWSFHQIYRTIKHSATHSPSGN